MDDGPSNSEVQAGAGAAGFSAAGEVAGAGTAGNIDDNLRAGEDGVQGEGSAADAFEVEVEAEIEDDGAPPGGAPNGRQKLTTAQRALPASAVGPADADTLCGDCHLRM